MKSTFKESIPDTKAALDIFIIECDKEITRFNFLRNLATNKLKAYEVEAIKVKRKEMGLLG